MKSTNIIIAGAISLCLYNTAGHACESSYTTISCYDGIVTYTATHCKNNSTTTKCIKVNNAGNFVKLVSCTSGCATGYIPDPQYKEEVSTLCNTNYSNFLSCNCKCSDCTTTAWSGNAMIEYRTVATCDCSSGSAVCTKTPEYRCHTGWYGTPTGKETSNFSQCSSCPTKTGDSRATSTAGSNTQITHCYIPAGTYTDDTGTYTLTQKCNYTE